VSLTVVDLPEFPELGGAYQVSVVPRIWIDGRIAINGAAPEEYLVKRMAEAAK